MEIQNKLETLLRERFIEKPTLFDTTADILDFIINYFTNKYNNFDKHYLSLEIKKINDEIEIRARNLYSYVLLMDLEQTIPNHLISGNYKGEKAVYKWNTEQKKYEHTLFNPLQDFGISIVANSPEQQTIELKNTVTKSELFNSIEPIVKEVWETARQTLNLQAEIEDEGDALDITSATNKILKEIKVQMCKPGSFSYALEMLKSGKEVRRKGWNGKGMFLKYIQSREYKVKPIIMKEIEQSIGGKPIALSSWIGMKTADDTFVPWLASQTDLLSMDWEIVTKN
jgi:hypothetical protein